MERSLLLASRIALIHHVGSWKSSSYCIYSNLSLSLNNNVTWVLMLVSVSVSPIKFEGDFYWQAENDSRWNRWHYRSTMGCLPWLHWDWIRTIPNRRVSRLSSTDRYDLCQWNRILGKEVSHERDSLVVSKMKFRREKARNQDMCISEYQMHLADFCSNDFPISSILPRANQSARYSQWTSTGIG